MPKWPIHEVADPSLPTGPDWAELNKLKAAYESGGSRAVSKAIASPSAEDPIGCACLLAALFPEMMREWAKDALAEAKLTESDLCNMLEDAERETASPFSAKLVFSPLQMAGARTEPVEGKGPRKGTILHQCPC